MKSPFLFSGFFVFSICLSPLFVGEEKTIVFYIRLCNDFFIRVLGVHILKDMENGLEVINGEIDILIELRYEELPGLHIDTGIEKVINISLLWHILENEHIRSVEFHIHHTPWEYECVHNTKVIIIL